MKGLSEEMTVIDCRSDVKLLTEAQALHKKAHVQLAQQLADTRTNLDVQANIESLESFQTVCSQTLTATALVLSQMLQLQQVNCNETSLARQNKIGFLQAQVNTLFSNFTRQTKDRLVSTPSSHGERNNSPPAARERLMTQPNVSPSKMNKIEFEISTRIKQPPLLEQTQNALP